MFKTTLIPTVSSHRSFIFCVAKFGVTVEEVYVRARAPALGSRSPRVCAATHGEARGPLPTRQENAPDVLMQRVEKTRMCWFLSVYHSSAL